MQLLLSFLLQDTTSPAGGGPGFFIMMMLVMVVFYFFMIRPQAKKQKEEQAFRSGLSKGDKVMSTGGIHGKVVSLEENSVLVQVDDNVKIRIDRNSIRPIATAADSKA